MLNRAPGLVIGKEGIYDNWNFASAAIIPWDDVVDISAQAVMNQTLHFSFQKRKIDRSQGGIL